MLNAVGVRASGKILTRRPKSLHKALIEKAKEEGVKLNQPVVYLLSMGIGRSKAVKVKMKDAPPTPSSHVALQDHFPTA